MTCTAKIFSQKKKIIDSWKIDECDNQIVIQQMLSVAILLTNLLRLSYREKLTIPRHSRCSTTIETNDEN